MAFEGKDVNSSLAIFDIRASKSRQLRRSQRTRNPIADIYLSTTLLLLPLVALSLALSPADTALAAWSNGNSPIYLIGVLGLAAYRIARAVPSATWSPAFWLLISSAVFFGFGPLVEVYGNDATKLRLSTQNIAITEVELFNANMLSFISILGLTFGFWLHAVLRPQAWRAALTESRFRQRVAFKPEKLASAFIIGGMVMVHLFIKPSQWGQFDIILPGALTSISAIADVGFALAAYHTKRGSIGMRWMLILLWPVHLFLTVLSFAKTGLVIALLLPSIGAYLRHRSMMRLAAAALVCAGTFPVAQDFVSYGRAVILNDTGTIWNAGYEERVRITFQYISTSGDANYVATPTDQEETTWLRFNYSNMQAIGMRFRERGIFIDSLSNAWTLFVPRILWPDKPIYVGPGIEFYKLLTGRTGVSVGNTVIGDVYWQFGWTGTLVIMPMIGWFFAMMAWRSIEAVRQENFIRMPIVLLSVLAATSGMTNFLVNGIIALIPIYAAYLLLLRGVEMFTLSQKRSRRASSMPQDRHSNT